MTTIRAVPVGCGHYLPERVVENVEFEKTLDTSDEWIRARTGIERRHFAAEGEKTSDLAIAAAKAALADAGLEAHQIDAIVVATATPDQTFPSTATRVQAALGMENGFAFDMQAVCAGFIYALANANAMIMAGQAKRVMVIGAETFSRIMDWTDRGTCVLFGDGAGALILEAQTGAGDQSDSGILYTDLHSDGRFNDILYVDGGPSTTGTTGHLRMLGQDVFKHAVAKLSASGEASMSALGITADDVDVVVPHQANLRIIKKVAQKMGIPLERVILTVQDHGNTSAASIPLAMSVARQQKRIAKGDLILIEAIGGGLAWGSALMRW
ncbi:3-oxoacyl-[acyl-carrier-protein] synthase-3 [Rubricella aquisinus]|uniref:Beta-ketoacyl-[acyl-carrier-protein] synthase III n=1 Tax=Rubricella aquisinus TaxID=2028108 RepID=A0A840X0W1_9RHOB|nr:beta-ketoacyl-ACP synthase III [Rubricella aquisinus]MBB5516364.1 3-oxoacyl-[acyl-carrier-protein] synthase-3 [Rubricella aquisinus]